jgi:hypothetical protein
MFSKMEGQIIIFTRSPRINNLAMLRSAAASGVFITQSFMCKLKQSSARVKRPRHTSPLVNSTVMTRASHSCSRTTGIPMEWDPVRAIEVEVLNGGVAEKCGGQLRGRRKQCRWWWWWWWWSGTVCNPSFPLGVVAAKLKSRGLAKLEELEVFRALPSQI